MVANLLHAVTVTIMIIIIMVIILKLRIDSLINQSNIQPTADYRLVKGERLVDFHQWMPFAGSIQ